MEKLEIKEVKSGSIDFRELKPLQPENYKTLSKFGFNKMWEALSKKGFRVPFQVWHDPKEGITYILDGHQRRRFINSCQEKGIPLSINGQVTYEVPVVYIHAENKKDAAEMLLAIDSQYGDRELEGIIELMEEFEIDKEWMDNATAFEETFDGIDSAMRRLEAMKDEKDAEDDDYLPNLSADYGIKEGDLIEIGDHRLLCGDSTLKETYNRLFGDETATMVNTDPPYNVNYEGGTKDKLKILNDNMDEQKFFEFLNAFYTNLNQYVKPGGAWYIWHADSEGATFRNALKGSNILFKQVLIWVKNQFTIGRQDYQWQHEPCIEGENSPLGYDPCIYGWKEGAAHEWYSDRKQSTILQFPKPLASGEHPTMKPVEMIGYQIKNNSVPGDIVADGFLGSGTTMIASEQLNRRCYAVELDPRFCNVTIDRMLKLKPEILIKVNGEPLKMKAA